MNAYTLLNLEPPQLQLSKQSSSSDASTAVLTLKKGGVGSVPGATGSRFAALLADRCCCCCCDEAALLATRQSATGCLLRRTTTTAAVVAEAGHRRANNIARTAVACIPRLLVFVVQNEICYI